MNGALMPALEWTLFLTLSIGSIAGAYRMLRTMSMVRSGIFLMGSFCAIAGLFLLLSADLLASMQIMMYVGGMLVMILFMVMMMQDPGGSMMGIAPPEGDTPAQGYYCPMHPEIHSVSQGKCPKCGMQLQPKREQQTNEQDKNGGNHSDGAKQKMEQGGMDMGGMGMDMAMTHEFTKPAAAIGTLVAVGLLAAIFTVKWPEPATLPVVNAAEVMGKELLSRYMIAFEAAAILIILGVVCAAVFGRKT